VARDEADIIRFSLYHAAAFCHRIYFVDHSSTDGTWEIVQDVARVLPSVVPFGRRAGAFGRGIHAHVFNETRSEHAESDWWMILDADEFLEEDPRPLLAATARQPFEMVRFLQAHFMITDGDLEASWFNRKRGEVSSFGGLPGHYRFDWIETRLFRNSAGLQWPEFRSDGELSQRMLPLGLRGAHARELVNRHYQHRSMEQIQGRLRTRAEEFARTGEFRHVAAKDWRSVVAEHRGLRYLPAGRTLTCSLRDRVWARWRKRRKKQHRRRSGIKRDQVSPGS